VRRSTLAFIVTLALTWVQAMFTPVGVTQGLPELFRRTSPSVVLVVTGDTGGTPIGFGSGVILSPDGLVATNEHVIQDADRILLRLASGREVAAVALVRDAGRDLAILWTPVSGLASATLGDSDRLQVGQSILAIGNPRGLEHTLSTGIVSGIRQADGYRYIQTTVPISPGSSGGPLLNMNGEVIGLAMETLPDAQNLNFALPSNDIRAALARARIALREVQAELARRTAREEAARKQAEAEAARKSAIEAEQRERDARQAAKEQERQQAAARRAAAARAAQLAKQAEAETVEPPPPRAPEVAAARPKTLEPSELALPKRAEKESPALPAPPAPRPVERTLLPPPPVTPPVAALTPPAAPTRLPEPPRIAAPPNSGSNVSVDARDFPFTYYLRQVHAKVSERWRRPPLVSTEQTATVVYFEIDREGQIRGDPKIKQSSGNELYDRAALQAVVDAIPFPPLPREFPGQYLKVNFGFDPGMGKG
jgi:TonB family protein